MINVLTISDVEAETFAEHEAMEAKVRQSHLSVLKGLLPVHVAVLTVGDDILNQSALRSAVMEKFRQAGIPLVTDRPNVRMANTPWFRVVVKVIGAAGTTVLQVNSQLEEAGEVSRNGQDIPAGVVTWHQSTIESMPSEQVAKEVPRMIEVTVRDFTDLYAAANKSVE